MFQQARQDSNLQPPVLEPTPSNAGVAALVDFQQLSFELPTPAVLDNAGVGTNPGTECGEARPTGGSTLLSRLIRSSVRTPDSSRCRFRSCSPGHRPRGS